MMRVLALIVVVWSFVGMPTLCRAGILVECCTLGVPGHEKSHDAPDKCPNNCPCDNRDKCPDDTESSEPRDCDSCAESCNVVSTHSKQTDGDDFAVMLVALIAVTQVTRDAFLPHQHRSRNLNTMWLGKHLPILPSDRPLLI